MVVPYTGLYDSVRMLRSNVSGPNVHVWQVFFKMPLMLLSAEQTSGMTKGVKYERREIGKAEF